MLFLLQFNVSSSLSTSGEMTLGKDVCELKLMFYKNLTFSINIDKDTLTFVLSMQLP